jgi:hypothetical protein
LIFFSPFMSMKTIENGRLVRLDRAISVRNTSSSRR